VSKLYELVFIGWLGQERSVFAWDKRPAMPARAKNCRLFVTEYRTVTEVAKPKRQVTLYRRDYERTVGGWQRKRPYVDPP